MTTGEYNAPMLHAECCLFGQQRTSSIWHRNDRSRRARRPNGTSCVAGRPLQLSYTSLQTRGPTLDRAPMITAGLCRLDRRLAGCISKARVVIHRSETRTKHFRQRWRCRCQSATDGDPTVKCYGSDTTERRLHYVGNACKLNEQHDHSYAGCGNLHMRS